jgi:hypothetical protein
MRNRNTDESIEFSRRVVDISKALTPPSVFIDVTLLLRSHWSDDRMVDADISTASRAGNALIHFISLPLDDGIVARERLSYLNCPVQTHSGHQQSRLRSQSPPNEGRRKTAKAHRRGALTAMPDISRAQAGYPVIRLAGFGGK